jgi:acetyl esterase
MSRDGAHFVDADIRRLLDEADPDAADFWEMTPAEARDVMDAMVDGMLPPVEVARVTDLVTPAAAAGAADVPARLYRPDAPTAGELFVFIHGGGWQVGSVETYDRPIRRLANDSGMSVLSVDYRLAPEHPFPAALDDCMTTLEWATGHADEIGVDGTFVAVGGDSAGGNLAAAVAQRARDESGPRIDHQLLLYPVVSRRFDTPSYEAFADGYFLTMASMRSFWQLYLGDDAPPYADLYAAGDLAGLPPATVFSCGLDPLRDEGEEYADRLARAGVPTTLIRTYGLIHGTWIMDATVRRGFQFGLDVAHALRRAASNPPNA